MNELYIGGVMPPLDEEMRRFVEEIDNRFRYGNNRYRSLKLALLEKYGVCFWCQREVKDYGTLPPGTRNPHDMATIDHLISRFYRKKGDKVLKVLACEGCNTKRAHLEGQLLKSQGINPNQPSLR